MQFINIKELGRSPSKYVKLANEKDDIIITRNGHPYAMMVKFQEEDMEDFILAKYIDVNSEFESAKSEYKSGKTSNIHDLLKDLDESSD
ncbi:type II toxin-antitoxin system prevent-host-death family antitoxin [bacterium]|nr:type II toxin-antitoxin system prevent-host-death family antitoxin [bacterium]